MIRRAEARALTGERSVAHPIARAQAGTTTKALVPSPGPHPLGIGRHGKRRRAALEGCRRPKAGIRPTEHAVVEVGVPTFVRNAHVAASGADDNRTSGLGPETRRPSLRIESVVIQSTYADSVRARHIAWPTLEIGQHEAPTIVRRATLGAAARAAGLVLLRSSRRRNQWASTGPNRCSRAARGSAPTTRSTSLPSWITTSNGIDCAPNRLASPGFASTSTFTTFRCPT